MSTSIELQPVFSVISACKQAFADYADRHPEDFPEAYFLEDADLDVNPYYGQCEGHFLEYANGVPNSIWTKWGMLQFCSGAHGTKEQLSDVSAHIRAMLSAVPFREGTAITPNYFSGPVYRICRAGNVNLPYARQLMPEEYLPPTVCEAEWQKLLGAA